MDDRRKALIERIRRANPPLDSLPEAELRLALRSRLDQELAGREANMDRLIPFGVQARDLAPGPVNETILEWMSADDSPGRTEVGAWFLAGLWNDKTPAVPEPLVELALDRLDASEGRPRLLEPLLMALAYLPSQLLSPEVRSRIVRVFHAVRVRGDDRKLARVAVQALESVLGRA